MVGSLILWYKVLADRNQVYAFLVRIFQTLFYFFSIVRQTYPYVLQK